MNLHENKNPIRTIVSIIMAIISSFMVRLGGILGNELFASK